MKREVAVLALTEINASIKSLMAALAIFQEKLAEAELAPLQRGIARVLNTLDLYVVEEVTREHPDLAPWKE
jgi:hypothetical protein